MAKYLDNLKWIISGKTEAYIESNIKSNIELNLNSNSNPNFYSKYNSNSNTNKHRTELEFDSTYDSESEFENVYTLDKSKINIEEIKKEYGNIQMELIKKEQLVRSRLDSDTIEQIKSNCKEYVNDDIKIIKDFAIVMESFNHIKEKLIGFETGMKEFESDIKIKTSNQELSNAELDNRINMIDRKLNTTMEMIEQMNLTSNELMEKIVKLENIINTHSTQREELLKKLNNVELSKHNSSEYYNKYMNFTNSIIFKILLGSTCAIGSLFVFKYIWKKK